MTSAPICKRCPVCLCKGVSIVEIAAKGEPYVIFVCSECTPALARWQANCYQERVVVCVRYCNWWTIADAVAFNIVERMTDIEYKQMHLRHATNCAK